MKDLENKVEIPENMVRVELKARRKYSFCTCGHSKNLPCCDNTHRKINDQQGTSYKSLKIIPEKDCIIYVFSSNWQKEKKE